MLAGTPVLVTAEYGEHCAGVRSADGHLWLSHWTHERPDRVAGTRLEGLQPARIGHERHAAVGGAAPGGTRAVEVLGDDDLWHPGSFAAGAWVVFVPWLSERGGRPVVRFLDEAGRVISRADPVALVAARPLEPHGIELKLLGLVACPVCDVADWVGVSARGPGSSSITVTCRACGHDAGSASFFAPL